MAVVSQLAVRAASVIGVALLAGACSHATARHPDGAPYRVGTFHFEDETRGQISRIQGTVTLLADSATIDMPDANCQPMHRLYDNDATATFHCDGAQLSDVRVVIDRWKPEQSSSWSGRIPTNAMAATCALYATLPSGERYCARYQSTAENTSASVGGRLRMVGISR